MRQATLQIVGPDPDSWPPRAVVDVPAATWDFLKDLEPFSARKLLEHSLTDVVRRYRPGDAPVFVGRVLAVIYWSEKHPDPKAFWSLAPDQVSAWLARWQESFDFDDVRTRLWEKQRLIEAYLIATARSE